MIFSVVINSQHWAQWFCIYYPSFVLSFFVSLLLLSFQLCGWKLPLVVPLFWWCPWILLQSPLSFLSSLIRQCMLPWNDCGFLCVVGSAVFSSCHSQCFFRVLEKYYVYYYPWGCCLVHLFYLLFFYISLFQYFWVHFCMFYWSFIFFVVLVLSIV